ncbi:MAG: CDP-diacylglycerol--serine O-phosphatidyltransferase [Hyphomicrobium sp.]|nr:CDP-diacylglycerol--serine O-phosphatidyltransferase [Hyphomicrobium sp.]
MDPVFPRLASRAKRLRRRPLFKETRIPARMLVPNFFTLLGLCAGLTSIRMSIEGRWDLALAAIVFAALLDGIDGRIARLLKASSRFGAELDSLADFVNFGVAPAFLLFTWGFGEVKNSGWIAVMIFALASALRLARFNVSADDVKPRWQTGYFVGVPTPAAAIIVLLPFYLHQLGLGLAEMKPAMMASVAYTVVVAVLMVSTVPTFSGKLIGERIAREWVMPAFMLAIGYVACLVTYPYEALTLTALIYLLLLPLSWRRHRAASEVAAREASDEVPPRAEEDAKAGTPPRVVDLRTNEPRR